MTFKNNIDPIYFNFFVGTWKRASSNGSITNGYIKFNNDCTFEHDGSLGIIEGTVNGDVDEVAVEDDGHMHDRIKTKARIIKGNAVLINGSKKQNWSFRMGKGRAFGIKKNNNILELQNSKGRVIYVGNLPLSDGKITTSYKKKVNV